MPKHIHSLVVMSPTLHLIVGKNKDQSTKPARRLDGAMYGSRIISLDRAECRWWGG